MQKGIIFILACLLTHGSAEMLAGADKKPKISIREVLDIAEEYLKARKLEDKVYIASVAIETRGALSRESFWAARWSEEVPSADGTGEKETGIQVTMEGVATRLVKVK